MSGPYYDLHEEEQIQKNIEKDWKEFIKKQKKKVKYGDFYGKRK